MWFIDLQKALENLPEKFKNRFVISKIIPGDGCIVFRGTGFTDLVYYYNSNEWKWFDSNGMELSIWQLFLLQQFVKNFTNLDPGTFSRIWEIYQLLTSARSGNWGAVFPSPTSYGNFLKLLAASAFNPLFPEIAHF